MNWMIQRTHDWDPLSEVATLQREMNRLFGDFSRPEAAFPPINVWGNTEQTLISAEIPGLDPDQIHLDISGRHLTLSGERQADAQGVGETHRRERALGAFARTVSLPYEVDADKAKAVCRNGVLTVTLPRHEATKPRAIRVQTA